MEMMANGARRLRSRLKSLGLTDAAIRAAWPRWWSDDAERSASAQAELRFGVARRLGLDPRSLFDDERQPPRFRWRDEARFKHLSGERPEELAGIVSFAQSVATVTAAALRAEPRQLGTARDLREQILASGRPYVELLDILTLSWAVGIPTLQLRVFPWPQKRMAAMSVATDGTFAVMIGKESNFPATIAFYVAHELAHISLGHVEAGHQLVDLEDDGGPVSTDRDGEDQAADAFALELLTGDPRPTVLAANPLHVSGSELARTAANAAESLHIDPGTLALCFGYSTGNWGVANAALSRIYGGGQPVWHVVNAIARQQLAVDELPPDAADFLRSVLGEQSAA
jgi:hypothetical protein